MGQTNSYRFDGTKIVDSSEEEIFGIDLVQSNDPTGDAGFTRVDSFLKDELVTIYGKDDVFIVEFVIDGSNCRFVRVDGFPMLLEFVSRYAHPLVELQSKGFRGNFIRGVEAGTVIPFPRT